jgi:hypothetical protein
MLSFHNNKVIYFFSIEQEKKEVASKDPLTGLAKLMGGSKRNALLKWCQQKTLPYSVRIICRIHIIKKILTKIKNYNAKQK